MAPLRRLLSLAGLMLPALCEETASPINKVLSLMGDLQKKIIKEGEEATKTYNEFSEWCEERSKSLQYEIKTGMTQVEELQASIAKSSSTMDSLDAKLEELAASTAKDDADLNEATLLRAKERTDFEASEAELLDIVQTLTRAIRILQRELAKTGGAALVQLKSAGNVLDALKVLVEASALTAADERQLTALVQQSTQAEDQDGDEEVGAPSAAVYEGQSGGIVDTMQGLLDKANEQLEQARNKETAALHEFEMTKQSLEDGMKVAKKEMAEAKQGIAAAAEQKASDEGELQVTQKELAEDKETLGGLHQNCMTTAQDYESQTKSRGEELDALATAKKAIQEKTAAAESRTYNFFAQEPSFVQITRSGAAAQLKLTMQEENSEHFEAVRLVRDLAKRVGSASLTQMATRMSVMMRAGAGEDIFAKVKTMITDMIAKLEDDADADATKKAYCDKELKESRAKKEDKTAEVEKLSTKIDKMVARSAKLKEEVSSLQSALAELAKAQAQMDKLRKEEKDEYEAASTDIKQGLEGIKIGLKALRDYYNSDKAKDHESASGAGSGIIGLLEVVQSDFEKNLVELTEEENEAQNVYDRVTKENEIEKTTKEQDVKYKGKEAADLASSAEQLKGDRGTVQAELDAVLQYLKGIEAECIAKAETFEERAARFAQEVAGLKEALKILEGQASLLQYASKRRLRRVQVHSNGAVE